ncbi:hypothetical protein NL676_023649 [Syzygium grande]|nr:hypothetical protein NL676_023649 [Syzygium grande]
MPRHDLSEDAGLLPQIARVDVEKHRAGPVALSSPASRESWPAPASTRWRRGSWGEKTTMAILEHLMARSSEREIVSPPELVVDEDADSDAAEGGVEVVDEAGAGVLAPKLRKTS